MYFTGRIFIANHCGDDAGITRRLTRDYLELSIFNLLIARKMLDLSPICEGIHKVPVKLFTMGSPGLTRPSSRISGGYSAAYVSCRNIVKFHCGR